MALMHTVFLTSGRSSHHLPTLPYPTLLYPAAKSTVNFRVMWQHQILEWDAWTFEPKGRRSLHAEVRSLAFSQDSTLLALLTYDGIFVVEVGTGLSMEELVSFGREADCRMEYQRRDDPVQACIRLQTIVTSFETPKSGPWKGLVTRGYQKFVMVRSRDILTEVCDSLC